MKHRAKLILARFSGVNSGTAALFLSFGMNCSGDLAGSDPVNSDAGNGGSPAGAGNALAGAGPAGASSGGGLSGTPGAGGSAFSGSAGLGGGGSSGTSGVTAGKSSGSSGAGNAGTNAGGSSGSGNLTAGGAGSSGKSGGGGTPGAAAGSGGSGGGSAGTAGSAGSSTTAGAAGLGGESLCTPGKYIVCENFESGSIPSGWTMQGSVTVASDQAARGTRSLKVGQADSGARRIQGNAAAFGSSHWGRIFYRVQAPTPGVFVHSTLVALQGTGPTVGSAEYRVVDTVQDAQRMHQFLWNVQPSGAEYGKGSPYDFRFDGAWHCAEWHVDAATQTYRFYHDGMEVTQIAISNGAGDYGSGNNRTDIPMMFSQIRVGWNNYQQASPGFIAWIDELAIASSRIGCGN